MLRGIFEPSTQTRFEWRDNVQFMAGIALSFLVGHALAHVPAVRSKFGKR